ncbi:alpha/beta hydrolase domain-containing protein [Bosea sp. BK604]|uniref:alpha/beta hydrolase domain-containing protein n=1 Tax=Bosea sp. BK604 TaxID=2512180 RepID=UPI0010463227|nr:alpha/beta hydrolase domain-containing protein [Bosea sp. BK604]TCR61816.1 hypothetical protein EV560_112156 [Bosea sp. BK604]
MSLRLDISSRKPFAQGDPFGAVGAYEAISGKAFFAIDPLANENAAVVDLALAPRDADGLVSLSADFFILKPIDINRSNRRLFFDYGNRGNKRALQFFNDAPAANRPTTLDHAGNGFLMRSGYTIVWLGWQGDLLPGSDRLLLDVPTATQNGQPIVGTIRTEFVATKPGTLSLPLSSVASTRSYPPVSRDTTKAQLTRRRYAESRRVPIEADAWSFARVEHGSGVEHGPEIAIVPSDSHLYVAGGFEPGWIYELIYEARDPLVLGLGHVAVRDFVDFLRTSPTDSDGTANPLQEQGAYIEKAYAWGRSQTGRCIRDFLYLGFNDNGRGEPVFDGVLPHVAGAGKKWLNHRFANAVVLSGCEYENHFTVVDRFPFAYASSIDHLTGRTDAILKRPATDPLVIHTDTCSEYWNRRGSLVVTDTQGNDLPQPDIVRVYMWASSQHFAAVENTPPQRGLNGLGEYLDNIVSTSMFFRATLTLLDVWATTGKAPPPSHHPRREDATLVSYQAWKQQFPAIPGRAIPKQASRLRLLDFGPDIDRGVIGHHPPRFVGDREYAVLVPAVDRDGIDLAGVKAPMVQAPLGTYVGWNLRRSDLGLGAMLGVTGSYLPFPEDEEEREQSGDPRISIMERYPSSEAYREAIRQAAERLAGQGLMLWEDVEPAVRAAADWGRPRHVVRLRAQGAGTSSPI